MNKFEFQKAIVTGGAGFIGSHLVEELVNTGIEVISIDDFSAGKNENLEHLSKRKNLSIVRCDITNYNDLDKYFNGVDVVFHQAASKKTICLKDPRRDLQVNGEGTFNILSLCIKHKVKKYVHASTGSVYGEPVHVPQDETHPLCPTSYYGVSKLAGERYVKVFENLYGLNTTILRYFHVYGPRQESSDVGGVVSIFVKKMLKNKPITIFGDGTQQRSFTYVKDVVKANMLSATIEKSNGQLYNCASGLKITIKQLADKISKILNIKNQKIIYDNWLPGDIKTFDIDNSKICNDFNIDFLTDFDKGLSLTVDWGKKFFDKKI